MTSKFFGLIVLVLAVAVAACEKKNPAEPSQPTTFVFNATLSSANEVPPVSNAEAGAGGSVTITMTVTRDSAGDITGANIQFQCNLTGLPTTSSVNIAHIHEQVTGQNGPIRVNTTLAPGEVVIAGNGTGAFNKTVTGVDVNVARALIGNPAGFYFNVHTTLNGGGVVRGQLTLTSSS
jgi:hypothetical protein